MAQVYSLEARAETVLIGTAATAEAKRRTRLLIECMMSLA